MHRRFLARRRKIDLNGLKPDAVRCLSVTGERKVDLSFLRDREAAAETAREMRKTTWHYKIRK